MYKDAQRSYLISSWGNARLQHPITFFCNADIFPTFGCRYPSQFSLRDKKKKVGGREGKPGLCYKISLKEKGLVLLCTWVTLISPGIHLYAHHLSFFIKCLTYWYEGNFEFRCLASANLCYILLLQLCLQNTSWTEWKNVIATPMTLFYRHMETR